MNSNVTFLFGPRTLAALFVLLLLRVCATSDGGTAAESGQEMLIRELEAASTHYVVRGPTGAVYGLTIPGRLANDRTLSVVSGLPSLAELKLFIQSSGEDLTAVGVGTLRSLTNLDTLRISCAASLNPGVLDSVCRLKTLRFLSLNYAMPPVGEYSSLTNLVYLRDLSLYGVSNFGDAQFEHLTHLPLLRQLVLSQATISASWMSLMPRFPSLTNAIFWKDGECVSWSRNP